MNDDALAAVVAAARLLIARASAAAPSDAPPTSRWALAARLGSDDAAGMRVAARARSRWSYGGRPRG